MGRIVFAGFLIRFPVGGYAWQTAHYLLGLRQLGHDVWFYEDTGEWDSSMAYNPLNGQYAPTYDYGAAATSRFLDQIGFGDRWVFVDAQHGHEFGPAAGRARTLLRDADLVINLGAPNKLSFERRSGRASIFVDSDPVYTQLRVANGDHALEKILKEQTALFTYGENIGTNRSCAPTAGLKWHPTRPPIALDLWKNDLPPVLGYTTIGVWNSQGRDLQFEGETFQWRKRSEWLKCLELPRMTGAEFEIAMDVEKVPGDEELLESHRWTIRNPREISADFDEYRNFIKSSRGEFTVAKGMNIRFRSGWFSDRAACYLAAGRPAIEGDTGFADVLPVGPGLWAFRDVREAAEAIRAVERNYAVASAHAAAVAREYFAADRVLGPMLKTVGL